MTHGRSLELFFVDGKPDGILTAEVFNWTGHVLRIPRTEIAKGLKRDRASNAGVYLLVGERDGKQCANVGEGEDVASRIRSHDQTRDWWTDVIIITTLSNYLHKAHIKYLESRIVEKAKQADTFLIENGNTLPRSSLSEAAQANMEEFLEILDLVLASLRIELMITRKRTLQNLAAPVKPPAATVFFLKSQKGKLTATAWLIENEFIVQAGSGARPMSVAVKAAYTGLHEELLRIGAITVADDTAVFASHYAFNSPSAAAAVVLGRSANGRLEWRLADGRTYADWEADQLAIAS